MMENNDRETLNFSSLWIDFLNDSIPSGKLLQASYERLLQRPEPDEAETTRFS